MLKQCQLNVVKDNLLLIVCSHIMPSVVFTVVVVAMFTVTIVIAGWYKLILSLLSRL